MHRALPLLLALAPALAGCTAPQTAPAPAGDTGATGGTPADGPLAFSDFVFENLACEDRTQFRVTLRNNGPAVATAVQFAAQPQGSAAVTQDLGDLEPGAVREVAAEVMVTDTCGQEDRVPLQLTATPSNGPAATHTVTLST